MGCWGWWQVLALWVMRDTQINLVSERKGGPGTMGRGGSALGEATCSLKVLWKGVCHPLLQPWRRMRAPNPREEAGRGGEGPVLQGAQDRIRPFRPTKGQLQGDGELEQGAQRGAVPGQPRCQEPGYGTSVGQKENIKDLEATRRLEEQGGS